jgi:trigger factor
MGALLKALKITIPQLLIDAEVDRLLSQTLDEIKKLGLTLDQYLASTGKTPEQLRADYAQKAENDIKIEFALQKIAESEKITVEQKEIDEAITQAKSEQEKASLESNKYLLANILRQQKTLDFLKNL